MSENERTATELACSLGTIRCPNRVALARDIESSLAAAEERGRRRGVEQCRDLVRSWAPTRPNTTVLIGYAFEQLGTLLDLAPRDSGKES